MPRLPDANDLGAVDYRSARQAVNVPTPDIAGAMNNLARGVSDVGEAAMRQAQSSDEKMKLQERFDTRMGLLKAKEKIATKLQDLDPLDPQFPDKVRGIYKDNYAPVLLAVQHPDNQQYFSTEAYGDYVSAGAEAEGQQRSALGKKALVDIKTYTDGVKKQVAERKIDGETGARLIREAFASNQWLSEMDRIQNESKLVSDVALASVENTATDFYKSRVALVPQLKTAISSVANQPGMPTWMGGYLSRIATIESSGGRNLVNKENPGVAGPYQFDEATARDVGLRPQDRNDFAASTAGAARLAMARFNELKAALGRDPTMSELYLAHQQGASGAIKLLKNPDAPASSVVGKDAIAQNGGWDGMTAEQFVSMWDLKYDGQDAPDDPDEVRGLLATNPAFNELTADEQTAAVKWAMDVGTAQERDQREQVRLQREEIYKEFSDLDAAGQLSQEWVDAQKQAGIANARELRIFENTLRNKKQNMTDDKEEVASIANLINNAKTDDDVTSAQIALDEAYADSKISNPTKARIAAGIKAKRSSVKQQNEFITRGEKLIARSVRSRDYSSGDPAEDEITEMAGKIAFQNWLDKNKDATELQIVTEAGRIAKDAAMDRVQTVRSSIDLPIGLKGVNRKTITREDIYKYALSLQKQQPMPGREDVYLREVELLKKWLEIIDIQEMAGE